MFQILDANTSKLQLNILHVEWRPNRDKKFGFWTMERFEKQTINCSEVLYDNLNSKLAQLVE